MNKFWNYLHIFSFIFLMYISVVTSIEFTHPIDIHPMSHAEIAEIIEYDREHPIPKDTRDWFDAIQDGFMGAWTALDDKTWERE